MTRVADVPIVGTAVPITFFDGAHNVHNMVAHVLSVSGTTDPGSDEPALSVAFPDPNLDANTLASANWARGYRRMTGVKHISHPDVVDGRESIAWGGSVNVADQPSIPQPDGDGHRPYFTRQDDPERLEPSIGMAGAAQTGAAPRPTTQSPLLNGPDDEPVVTEPARPDEVRNVHAPEDPHEAAPEPIIPPDSHDVVHQPEATPEPVA